MIGKNKERNYNFSGIKASNLLKRGYGNSGRDGFLKDTYKFYKPKDKSNNIRILPPTWDNPGHWGVEVWVHYSVGPNESSYLCLEKMGKGVCPVCQEREKADVSDVEYIGKLIPIKRVVVALIDRDAEKDGIKIWAMPQSLDSTLSIIAVDKVTKSVIEIYDAVEGFDISFEMSGKGKNTKYTALQIARRSTPLGNPEWETALWESPLTENLVYFTGEHIAGALHGVASTSSENAASSKEDAVEDSGSETVESGYEGMSWEDLQGCTEKEVHDIAKDLSLPNKGEIKEVKICIGNKLGMKIPEEKTQDKPKEASMSVRDRLKAAKEKRDAGN